MRIWTLVLLVWINLQNGITGAERDSAKERSAQTRSLFEAIFGKGKAQPKAAARLDGLSSSQLTAGIKEALEIGLHAAVSRLGQSNGFLTNVQVRIALPPQLAPVERALRRVKQDALVHEFEVAMNRAAERAVPAASGVFIEAVKGVSFRDAASLLASKSPVAITEYFQTTTSTQLFQKFLPLVQEATASTGVTAAYNQIVDKVSIGGVSLFSQYAPDLDEYVTEKAMDGLFKIVAEEEKRIRQNPQARSTELLRKVFGALEN